MPAKNTFLIPLKLDDTLKCTDPVGKDEKILLFDIDSTLYCESNGFPDLIRKKIYEYAKKKNIPADELKDICEKYTRTYGLAVKGFCKHFPGTDPDDFDLSVDGGADLSKFIKADQELKTLLNKLKVKKYCFTNANFKHATAVLNTMQIMDCFDGVFYCEYEKDGNFICKPDSDSFKCVEDFLSVDPKNIMFYDDLQSNVEAGKKRGWNGEVITRDYCIKTALKKYAEKENLLNNENEEFNIGEKIQHVVSGEIDERTMKIIPK